MPRVTALTEESQWDTLLDAIVSVFAAVRAQLELHWGNETNPPVSIQLPKWNRHGNRSGTLTGLWQEHDSAVGGTAGMRRLTDGYSLPARAARVWEMLSGELGRTGAGSGGTHSVGNGVLFPRAVAMEKGDQRREWIVDCCGWS